MGVEVLYPTSTVSINANLSGDHTDVDSGVDTPDGNWIIATSAVGVQATFGFDTPTNTPTVGDNLQRLRVWLRRQDNSTRQPKLNLRLYQGNALVRELLSLASINSTTGELFEGTFNINELSNLDGSTVEVRVQINRSGGSASERNAGEIGEVEWVVANSVSPVMGLAAKGN